MVTVRGATTSENTKDAILADTAELIKRMLSANNIAIGDITLCIFTCTADLDKAYPAAAAREIGITEASLLCLAEMEVKNSLEKCIRAMIQFNSDKKQGEVRHVYLKNAVTLRPDLQEKS